MLFIMYCNLSVESDSLGQGIAYDGRGVSCMGQTGWEPVSDVPVYFKLSLVPIALNTEGWPS